MARIRTIKPEFPQSESMGRVSRDARLLFVMLWTICDDSGRARGNSRMLASLLFPYDDDAPKRCSEWLEELARVGCVTLYEVGGDKYLEVANWLKHQKIDKPSPSKLPSPRESSRKVANPREHSSEDLGPRTCTKDLGKDPLPSEASGRSPLDWKKMLWQSGVAYLKANGVVELQARAVLGKWRKAHGDFEVLEALAAAESAAASEPIGYVQSVLNGRSARNGNGQGQSWQSPAGKVFGEIYANARAERERREAGELPGL